MHLVDLLSPSRVQCGLGVTSKKRLLDSLSGLLADGQGAELERQIYDSLCARERLGSTGLGHGVAIPHGRTPVLGTAVGAFVRLAEPVDFGAIDGQPVDLVFALAVPEHFNNQHLLLLSQLAELFSDPTMASSLREARDAAAIYSLLSDWQPKHAAA